MDSRKATDEMINVMKALSSSTSQAAKEISTAPSEIKRAADKFVELKAKVEAVLKEVDDKMPSFDNMNEDQIIKTMIPMRNRFDKLKGDLDAVKLPPIDPVKSTTLNSFKDALIQMSNFSPELQTNLNAFKNQTFTLDNLNKILPLSLKVATSKLQLEYIQKFKDAAAELSKAISLHQEAYKTIVTYKASVTKIFDDNKEVFDLVNEASPPAYTPVAAHQKLFQPASAQVQPVNARNVNPAPSDRVANQKK